MAMARWRRNNDWSCSGDGEARWWWWKSGRVGVIERVEDSERLREWGTNLIHD